MHDIYVVIVTFYIDVITNIWKSHKNATKNSTMPFTQMYQLVALCSTGSITHTIIIFLSLTPALLPSLPSFP